MGLRSANVNSEALYNGLLTYLYLIIIVTFHEFGHAWTAERCGDDTPRLQGRITLNPAMHIDRIGTVLLPLIVVALGVMGLGTLGGFIIGWGRPVQFNPGNLKHRRRDAMVIALAGPAMNVVLAAVAVGLIWGGVLADSSMVREACVDLAFLSLYLCFFNLLPIPPLDGSHLARGLLGFSEEVYLQLSRFGLFLIIIAVQLRPVRLLLDWLTNASFTLLLQLFRLA